MCPPTHRLLSNIISERNIQTSKNHRIRTMQAGGDLRSSLGQCPAPSRGSYELRLLRALSSWVLKTCKDAGGSVSLSILVQSLTVLVKKFCLMCSLNSSCFNFYLLSLLLPPWRAWLHLLNPLLTGAGGLLLCSPQIVYSPGWTSPVPSASPHGQVLQPLTSLTMMTFT